jgi:hypothetical protein
MVLCAAKGAFASISQETVKIKRLQFAPGAVTGEELLLATRAAVGLWIADRILLALVHGWPNARRCVTG